MITENLSKYLAYAAFRRNPDATQITMEGQGGETITESEFWNINANSQYKIAIGSGTTSPKKTDYKLENQITAAPASIDMTGGMATASITYKNTSSSDKTVTEVGLLTHDTSHTWMLARELLENPITVRAGETKSFSITLDFND